MVFRASVGERASGRGPVRIDLSISFGRRFGCQVFYITPWDFKPAVTTVVVFTASPTECKVAPVVDPSLGRELGDFTDRAIPGTWRAAVPVVVPVVMKADLQSG